MNTALDLIVMKGEGSLSHVWVDIPISDLRPGSKESATGTLAPYAKDSLVLDEPNVFPVGEREDREINDGSSGYDNVICRFGERPEIGGVGGYDAVFRSCSGVLYVYIRMGTEEKILGRTEVSSAL